MVTSAVYRQSSRVNPQQVDQDPRNILLARGSRHRLPAHVIRDQALFLAGLLVEKTGGPSVKPYQPPGLWADFSFGKIKYAQDRGASLYRRSLYTFWRRSLGPPNMFDEADRRLCNVRTQQTNTPLQALTLLNDVTFIEASRVFAERLLAEDLPDAKLIERAFRMATGRLVTDAETRILLDSLETARQHFKAAPGEAKKLLAVGEKPADATLPVEEIAALASVLNILLNTDEVISKE
jgi:hypothetical protein